MANIDNFKVVLCPDIKSAEAQNPDVTVEAEYGDNCVEGLKDYPCTSWQQK